MVGALEPPVAPVWIDPEVIDRVAHASKVSRSCVSMAPLFASTSWFALRLPCVPYAKTNHGCALQWVSSHGADFEMMLIKKHPAGSGWDFLHDGGSEGAQYYRACILYELQNQIEEAAQAAHDSIGDAVVLDAPKIVSDL